MSLRQLYHRWRHWRLSISCQSTAFNAFSYDKPDQVMCWHRYNWHCEKLIFARGFRYCHIDSLWYLYVDDKAVTVTTYLFQHSVFQNYDDQVHVWLIPTTLSSFLAPEVVVMIISGTDKDHHHDNSLLSVDPTSSWYCLLWGYMPLFCYHDYLESSLHKWQNGLLITI